MRTRALRVLSAAAAAAMAVALLPAAASAHHRADHQPPGQQRRAQEPVPADYIALAGTLSQPRFSETVRETFTVPTHDGEEVYVEVVRPDPEEHGEGPWPVVMEISPYHGTLADRDGIRIFPDPRDDEGDPIGMTGYFAPRGYAVAMVDLRGTGRSSGCLDHLGQNDAKDMKRVVEWAADADWSNGRVGLTGHSYVGSTPQIAAAQKPRGLVTIAPSAGLASMYDHQFQYGVPYYLQWAGPQWAYPTLSTTRDLPPGFNTPLGPTGDNFPSDNPEQVGCGWRASAATAGQGQAYGEYQAWHAERDWRAAASQIDIPVFMIHGVNDNAARIPAAEWFFGNRFDRPADKVWIGQWDHGSAGATRCEDADSYGHVNCRFDQWKYALHAWFDKHLQQRDVDTGPPVEAFLNGDLVYAGDAWERADTVLTLRPDADGSMSNAQPEEDGEVSFTAVAMPPSGSNGTGVEFVTDTLDQDLVVLGLPSHTLHLSQSTSQALNVITVLEREDEDGERHPMSYCAVQPMLRFGVSTPKPVTPGQEMELTPQCFTMAHHAQTGEKLVLSVRTSSPHHVNTFSEDLNVTVHTGPGKTRFVLPVVSGATLHPDVDRFEEQDEERPVGPAQGPEEGSVVVPLSGAGVIIEPLTAASFEFEVEEGFDNEELHVLAQPALPADIDLYLQRWNEEAEEWSDDLAAGETGSFEEERLAYKRPAPDRYRLVVHNWSGPPTSVDVLITFINQEGEVGE